MFSDPKRNIKYLSLDLGMNVADLGAGSGFYTFEAAELVGDKGKVFAVDVQKDLLSKIKNEAEGRNLKNIEIIWGDIDEEKGTKLKEDSMDAVIVSNVFFQLEKKEVFLQELKRILKPNGEVLFVCWENSFGGLGPREEDIVKKEDAKKLILEAGFNVEREVDVGDNHYGFILRLPTP